MSNGRIVRIGLVGAGWVSRHHLDAWRTLADRATVVAIADPDRSAAEGRAAEYAIDRIHSSAEDLLAMEELDAVDIATPREFHAPVCRLAAKHGVAILCQKPLAPTLDEAESLVHDIGDGARLMVHENWRFRPHYRRVADWLGKGLIGDVRTVVLSLLTSGLLPDADARLPALERQPMLAGLERMLLMEVMIHHVDTLRFLLGPLELKAARLGKACQAIRGEDRAALFMTGARGEAVTLIGDFMAAGHPPGQFDTLEIMGTSGAITLERNRLRLTGDVKEEVEIDLDVNYRASYVGAFSHFLGRLADGGPFETGPADNLETLRIVEAAYLTGWNAD